MNLDSFKDCLVITQKIHYGRQLVYRFGNYGLSVLEEPVGEGPIYNAAFIKFEGGEDHIYDVLSKDMLFDNAGELVNLLSEINEQ